MKKRAIIALILALTMALSLAACGKQDSPSETGGNDSPSASSEYVYQAQFSELGGGDSRLSPLAFTDDGFYAYSSEKVGENNPDGLKPEYEGQFDVYANVLSFVGYDGTVTKLSDYEPLPPAEDSEDREGFSSGSNISGMVPLDNGNLLLIEYVYSSWQDEDGSSAGAEAMASGSYSVSSGSVHYVRSVGYDHQGEQEDYIRTLDANGKELSCAKIELGENEYLNNYSMAADEDGNMLFASDTGIKAIAPDGTTAYEIESDSYVNSLIPLDDGVYATVWGDNGLLMAKIDAQSGSLGKGIAIPNDAYNPIPGDEEYDFYYTSGINLLGYKLETEEKVKILNWIDCDVNSNDLSNIKILGDGKIVGISNRWDDDEVTIELASLTKVPADSVPQKETLTLAVLRLDWEVRGTIIDFNRSNDKVRIEVLDYSEYNTEEDYSASRTKLLTEIMAGNVPDIIALNELPYEQLAVKGILEDLYPYFDADSELRREDYFENVFKAQELDGKLYAATPSFAIVSVLGAASVVGDEPGWNYDDFNAALASMPEGCEPFEGYVTQEQILQVCLALDLGLYMDWASGECSFDSPEFIQLLEFTKLFPGDFDWENYEWSEEENSVSRIAQGKQMLMAASIYSMDEIGYNDMYFGGDATYIGFPTSDGIGNVLSIDSGYAMSSSCENKEAAWEFLRMFFMDEYQEGLYGLPTKKSVFNKKLEEEMTPEYQTNENGDYLLDENGDKIEVSQGAMSSSDGVMYEFYAVTQEQADRLMDVINSTTKRADYSMDIYDIVMEQAQAFYAGQKTAEEVAKLIQSKASIYINEQR